MLSFVQMAVYPSHKVRIGPHNHSVFLLPLYFAVLFTLSAVARCELECIRMGCLVSLHMGGLVSLHMGGLVSLHMGGLVSLHMGGLVSLHIQLISNSNNTFANKAKAIVSASSEDIL